MNQVFARLWRRFRRVIVLYVCMGILQSFLGFLGLVYFQQLIDGIVAARSLSGVGPILLVYALVSVVNNGLILLDVYPYRYLNGGIYQWTKVFALRKIARIDYLAYQDLGTGQLVQMIESGAAAARDMLFGFYVMAVRGLLPSLVFSLLFTGAYDWGTAAVLLGGHVFIFVVSFFLLKYLRARKEKLLAHQEDFSRFSVRGFMELVVFRLNRRFPREIRRAEGLADEIARSDAQMGLMNELFFSLTAYVKLFVLLGLIVFQAGQIIAGRSTIGVLVALVNFVRETSLPIAIFNVRFADYMLDRVAFRRFSRFLSLPDDPGLAREERLVVDQGRVELRDVSFSYGERRILEHLSLVLAGGTATALVGTTGSGKSTIARLVLGLLKPGAGAVLVDGQDVSQVDLGGYYERVAYVPQDAPVFDGTMRENLAFDREVPDDDLLAVLDRVLLADLVAGWPDGLETEIGERGIKLSGGEKQRLAFGRVLLHDPAILVLDEPTSALDSVTEEFVTGHVFDLFREKTIILIAHRLQTVRNLDNVLVIEEGRVVQEGAFDDLVGRPGRFRELWLAQTGGRTL